MLSPPLPSSFFTQRLVHLTSNTILSLPASPSPQGCTQHSWGAVAHRPPSSRRPAVLPPSRHPPVVPPSSRRHACPLGCSPSLLPSSRNTLVGFSDASHGNCWDTRHSWSGYGFLLGSCLISWRSTKQYSVSISTTEAEYMPALSLTARQASWYIIGLQELDLKVPVTLKCDNTSTIDLSYHSIISQRSKHINIHYHFVRECLINKKFSIEYIESSSNPADTFTKALDTPKFTQFTQQFGCTV